MSKYTKNHDSNASWIIDESDQVWTLGKNAIISVGNEAAIYVATGYDDNTIKLNGDLLAIGSESEGVRIEGEGNLLRIAKSSQTEANVGVYVGSAGAIIKNAGQIDGDAFGILSESGIGLENRGRIEGNTALLIDSDSAINNLKGGVIQGESLAMRIVGSASASIHNDGIIRSDDVAMSVSGADGSFLVNRGKIVGDVFFGSGDDWLDTRSGKIKGVVDAGSGDDIYLVGKSHGQLSEKLENGWDEVRSTQSLTLAANFEKLLLLGNKSINGSGNDGQNQLQGNAGKNIMHGGASNDYVGGGAGKDQLFGDAGTDDFVYERGDGRDKVMDFDVSQDRIALLEFGFENSAEVAPLLSQHGDDTWISLGSGDRLVLKNVDMDDLTPEMFILGYASVAVM